MYISTGIQTKRIEHDNSKKILWHVWLAGIKEQQLTWYTFNIGCQPFFWFIRASTYGSLLFQQRRFHVDHEPEKQNGKSHCVSGFIIELNIMLDNGVKGSTRV